MNEEIPLPGLRSHRPWLKPRAIYLLTCQGCGRTDFPGGDQDEMYRSLHERLAKLPDDTLLYPGHLYGPEASASLGETRSSNYVFNVSGLEDWRRLMS